MDYCPRAKSPVREEPITINSDPWPAAKFPNHNLKTLKGKEREYTGAILQASYNHINYISNFSTDKELLFHMAEKSSNVSIKYLIFVSHCRRKY